MKKLLYITFLFLLPALLTSCNTKEAISRISIELKRVQLSEVTNTGMKATLSMQVDNPNWFSITVADMDYQLLIDGRDVADGRIEQEIKIPAHGSVVAELPAEVSMDGLEGLLNELLTGKMKYRVKGRVVFKAPLGSYTITFDKEKEIKKKQDKAAPVIPEKM